MLDRLTGKLVISRRPVRDEPMEPPEVIGAQDRTRRRAAPSPWLAVEIRGWPCRCRRPREKNAVQRESLICKQEH